MRRELKNIAEYRKPSNDAFAVVRSFGEANNRLKALAVESVWRAVEIQSQFVAKAYDTYFSEVSKLRRMFFVGYSMFTARPRELPHANLNEKKAVDGHQSAWAEAKGNANSPRTANVELLRTTSEGSGVFIHSFARTKSKGDRSANA